MVRLKNTFNKITLKVKSSSITETIVASTIILIVFTITIFSLNNILQQRITNDTSKIDQVLNEITYKANFKKLTVPDSFNEGNWIVNLTKEKEGDYTLINISAVHKNSNKKVERKIVFYEN